MEQNRLLHLFLFQVLVEYQLCLLLYLQQEECLLQEWVPQEEWVLPEV